MCLDRWSLDDDGFSLIEVILAVAILALVSVPILNYFTNSSLRTIDGRNKQTATMAAESAVEELNSYSNYKQIKDLTATAAPGAPAPSSTPVWKVSAAEPGETQDPQSDYIERKLTVNGVDYLAKAKIDYGVYKSGMKTIDDSAGEKIGHGTGDAINSKFNDYRIPKPSEVYSDSNVVAAEDDEMDSALSEFYTTVNASEASDEESSGGSIVDWGAIQQRIKRTVCVDVSYKDSLKEEYEIRVYYLYTFEYNGNLLSTEVTLQNTCIKTSKFKRVFVFYDPLRAGAVDEPIRIRTGSEIPGKEQIPVSEGDRPLGDEGTIVSDMEFYFAVQTTKAAVAGTKPSDYSVTVSVGNAAVSKFFANAGTIRGITASSPAVDGSTTAFVARQRTERIGRISVDVYELAPDGSVFGKSRAHMDTTIAE